MVGAYLQLLGPATAVEAAGFLGTTAKAIGWPVARWRAGGWLGDWPEAWSRSGWTGRTDGWPRRDELDEVAAAPAPDLVRLVAASDPYLQTRDRDLLVPDPAHRQALWKILASPGAVLVDGEVAGSGGPSRPSRPEEFVG